MLSNRRFCLMVNNKCLTGCYNVLENDKACKYSFFFFLVLSATYKTVMYVIDNQLR